MNYDQYSKIIIGLAGNFSATIEPATMDVWFDLFKSDGVSYVQLRSAAAKLMRTVTNTYGRMPTYAELMEAIRGRAPRVEDVALVEANKILDHLRRNGASVWPDLSDPVTKKLMTTRWDYPRWASECTESENHWWVKEFCEAYRATDATEGVMSIPHQVRNLIGGIGDAD
jgi:hypothetical protein